MKDSETSIIHWRCEMHTKNLVSKPKVKRRLDKTRILCKNNIKGDMKEILSEVLDWSELA
jgi:hypothetical protein